MGPGRGRQVPRIPQAVAGEKHQPLASCRSWGPSASSAPTLGPITVTGQSLLLHDRRGSVKVLHKDDNMDPLMAMDIDGRWEQSWVQAPQPHCVPG